MQPAPPLASRPPTRRRRRAASIDGASAFPFILKIVDASFTSALSRLDPASRALLDLSLRRGMRTEEIAEVLGADADTVTDSRDEALRRVAADVGMSEDEVRARLAELPAEQWSGGAAAPAAEEPVESRPEPDPEPEPEPRRDEPARKPPITPGARRHRSALPALLGLLLLAGVIVAIALA